MEGSLPPAPNRMQGTLMKRGDDMLKGWKKRYFVLQDNRVHYFLDSHEVEPLGSIDLEKATRIIFSPNSKKEECGFQIETEGRIYFLAASSRTEADKWVHELQQSQKYYTILRQSLMIEARKRKEGTPTQSSPSSLGLDQSQLKDLKARLEDSERRVEVLVAERDRIREEIDRLKRALHEKNDKREAELLFTKAKLEEKLAYESGTTKAYASQVESLKKKLAEQAEEIELLKKETESHRVQELERRVKELEDELEGKKSQLKNKNGELLALRHKMERSISSMYERNDKPGGLLSVAYQPQQAQSNPSLSLAAQGSRSRLGTSPSEKPEPQGELSQQETDSALLKELLDLKTSEVKDLEEKIASQNNEYSELKMYYDLRGKKIDELKARLDTKAADDQSRDEMIALLENKLRVAEEESKKREEDRNRREQEEASLQEKIREIMEENRSLREDVEMWQNKVQRLHKEIELKDRNNMELKEAASQPKVVEKTEHEKVEKVEKVERVEKVNIVTKPEKIRTTKYFFNQLWNGYDDVGKRIDHGMQACREIMEFFKKVTASNQEIADILNKLCQHAKGQTLAQKLTKTSNVSDLEKGAIRDIWMTFADQLEKSSMEHSSFALKVSQQVHGLLSSFLVQKEVIKKQLLNDGGTTIRKLNELIANAVKAKELSDKASAEADQAQVAFTRAQEEPKDPKTVAKLSASLTTAQDKAKNLMVKFQQTYTLASLMENSWYGQQMAVNLNELQAIDEERISTIKKAFLSFSQLEREMAEARLESSLKVAQFANQIEVEDEIELFVKDRVPDKPFVSALESMGPGGLVHVLSDQK